jgi:hypothetical protein
MPGQARKVREHDNARPRNPRRTLVRRHELETAGSGSWARVSAASESSGIASIRDSFENEIQSDRYSTNRIGTICEQCFTFKKPDRGSRLLLPREFVEARKPLILICIKALERKGTRQNG